MISTDLNRLEVLQNSFRHQRCFILGNGPSLKKHDLAPLRHEHVFAVNLFTLHSEFFRLRHLRFCLGDPRFYPNDRLLPEIGSRLAAHSSVQSFFDIRAGAAVGAEPHLNPNRVFFIEIDPAQKCWEGRFHANPKKKLAWGYTVIIDQCLPLAIYMGFKSIYLLGCDCNYGLGLGATDFSSAFFYDPAKVSPQYLESLHQSRCLPDQFNQSGKIFAAYETVSAFCRRQGIRILNAGYGGQLETFPRVDYNSLF